MDCDGWYRIVRRSFDVPDVVGETVAREWLHREVRGDSRWNRHHREEVGDEGLDRLADLVVAKVCEFGATERLDRCLVGLETPGETADTIGRTLHPRPEVAGKDDPELAMSYRVMRAVHTFVRDHPFVDEVHRHFT